MEDYSLILILFFTSLFGVVIVLLVKILTELQSMNRNYRNMERRPPPQSVSSTAQHRRD